EATPPQQKMGHRPTARNAPAGHNHEIINKYRGHVRAARMLWSSPDLALKSEKNGLATGGLRLFLVARRRPIRRPLAPVAGSAGQPFEGGMIGSSLKHPRQKVVIVGCKMQFGTVRHDQR